MPDKPPIDVKVVAPETTDVNIKAQDVPVEVKVVSEEKANVRMTQKAGGEMTLEPDTTEQEDITKAGQRRVNLIWEFTQAIIAVMITSSTIFCAIKQIPMEVLTNAFFLIVSMYFVRTNHTMIGGVGARHYGR